MYELLNLIIFLPLVGAAAIAMTPRGRTRTSELLAMLFSLAPLLIIAYLWATWRGSPDLQYGSSREWIPFFHMRYSIGVDGISMPMVALTGILSLVSILYSWGCVLERAREYYFFMLLLECFLQGVFCARDLVLFYVLFDAALIPMYFLIAIWGGERAAAAALKFFLYTLAGSAALLIGVLWVYFQTPALNNGIPTFDIGEITRVAALGRFHFQFLLFFLFGVAFAVKIPIFPFHTWLPDAYVESPTPVTAMLAGAMGKMGIYGFLRLALPFFPEAARVWATPLMVFGVISIIYGALIALAQWDLKRLVAYSSVSHMGFVALGIATACARIPAAQGGVGDPRTLALSGVVFEMFAHGIITGGLFLLIGLLSDRAGVRDLRTLTGTMRVAPMYVVVFALFMFASMAMPGLMGFPGELYILLGAFQVYPLATALSAIGIVVTAGFFVWALQRMAFGSTSSVSVRIRDLRANDGMTIAPLAILMLLFGIMPGLYLSAWAPTIQALAGYLR